MGHLKDSIYYRNAIQVKEYPFATYYLFDTFIVSEINEGISFTWDNHAKKVVKEFGELYEQKGKDMVLVSNRVYSFSVRPIDWFKFFGDNYSLKGYAIVSYTKQSLATVLIEKLFVRTSFRNFDNIDDAIIWAKSLNEKNKE